MNYINILIILITIQKTIGNFVLKDRGMKPYLTNSMALTFYATIISNQKDLTGSQIRLKMMLCCQIKSLNKNDNDESSLSLIDLENNSDWDCQSMKIHSGLAFHLHPNQTCTLTAFFLNKHILNRKGICTFNIHHVDNIPPFSIPFDTRVNQLSVPNGNGPGVTCESLDQDPLKNCEPIDCIAKYTGFRSYFNPDKQICEPTQTCQHDPEENEGEINLIELKRHEQHPVMVLDLKTNKCVNKSSHVSLIKSRSADDDHSDEGSKVSSVESFAAAYGLTLTKLGIAILLTCVFILAICVMINFCFGCWCGFPVSVTRRPPGSNSRDCHKYTPLPGDCPRDYPENVIKEVRDRREMRNKNLPPPPPQETKDNLELQSKQLTEPPQSTAGTLNQSGGKKLPNVAQFLQNFKQKQSKDYLHLSKIYGGSITNSNKVVRSLDTESTIHFENKKEDNQVLNNLVNYRDTTSKIVAMGRTPKFNQVIHKIQQDDDNNNNNNNKSHLPFEKSLQLTNELQNHKINLLTKQLINLQDSHRHNNHDDDDQVKLPSWASVSSFDTNTSYRQEMADAMKFMKQLENRRPKDKSSQTDHPPSPKKIENDNQTSPRLNLIRRIKDEPPIPMSMICQGVKFNDIHHQDQDNAINHNQTSSEFIPKKDTVPNTHSSYNIQFSSTISKLEKPTRISHSKSTSVQCQSRSRSRSKSNQEMKDEGQQTELNTETTPSSSTKDEETICDLFQFPELIKSLANDTPKTNAAEKIYQSALRLQDQVQEHFSNNTCDIFSQKSLQLDRGDSNHELTSDDDDEDNDRNVFKIMQQINSQNLIHSPPTLTNSELSFDGSHDSTSESQLVNRSTIFGNEHHFWDDEFQPKKKPSKSDQALQRSMWIDNFVCLPSSTSTPQGTK